MMGSRETYVNYTMPLGLHHMIGGNHYAPMPQNAGGPRKDWTAVYYHQASTEGIGFDRTMKGDKAVGQYFPPVRDMFDSLATCPEKFLLWFHRLPWDYRLKNGQTLWDGLVAHYYKGAADAAAMQATWASLAGTDRRAAAQGSRRPAGHPGGRRRGVARHDPEVFPAVQSAADRTAGRAPEPRSPGRDCRNSGSDRACARLDSAWQGAILAAVRRFSRWDEHHEVVTSESWSISC